MRNRKRILICLAAVCLLGGCRAGADDTAALRQQIDELQRQLEAMQQSQAPAGDNSSRQTSSAPAQGSSSADSPVASGTAATTDSIEALTELVDGFSADADAQISSGAKPELEQYFTLKQRAESIDRSLDRHEDEIERLYRGGQLSRDDYWAQERLLDGLEAKLDRAEDDLERYFGVDD